MKLTWEIPIKPVTVNKMTFCVRGRKVLSTEYRAFKTFVQAFLFQNATPATKEALSLTHANPRGVYALSIHYNKHHSSDYSNYTKAIEDIWSENNLTPDDKFSLCSPHVVPHGAPKKGFIISAYYGDTAEEFYKKSLELYK